MWRINYTSNLSLTMTQKLNEHMLKDFQIDKVQKQT